MIGIILAGGQSKRFGTDKATYHLPGYDASNVQLAVTKLLPYCNQVVVSANVKNQSVIRRQLRDHPAVKLVCDVPPYDQHGPLSGLVAVTSWHPEPTDYLLLAVDYPDLQTKSIAQLAAHPAAFVADDQHLHFTLAHFRTDHQTLCNWLRKGGNWRLGTFLIKKCYCHPLHLAAHQELCNLNYRTRKDQQ